MSDNPKRYLVLNISDSMFASNAVVTRKEVSINDAIDLLNKNDIIIRIPQKHRALIDELCSRYNVDMIFPDEYVSPILENNDSIMVVKVLFDGSRDMSKIRFSFVLWTVISIMQ